MPDETGAGDGFASPTVSAVAARPESKAARIAAPIILRIVALRSIRLPLVSLAGLLLIGSGHNRRGLLQRDFNRSEQELRL